MIWPTWPERASSSQSPLDSRPPPRPTHRSIAAGMEGFTKPSRARKTPAKGTVKALAWAWAYAMAHVARHLPDFWNSCILQVLLEFCKFVGQLCKFQVFGAGWACSTCPAETMLTVYRRLCILCDAQRSCAPRVTCPHRNLSFCRLQTRP